MHFGPGCGGQREHARNRGKAHEAEERRLLDALQHFVLLRRGQGRKSRLAAERCADVATQLGQPFIELRQLVLRPARKPAIDEVDHACLTSTRRVIRWNDSARERLDLGGLLAGEDGQRGLRLGDLVRRMRDRFAAFRRVGEEPDGAE
jgi:hypothetical protein